MADERSAAFPDVPTLKESGVNWSFTNWFALVAPKGLPAEVRARLVEAGGKAHAKPEVQDPLKQRGFNPNWSGPEKAREFALGYATFSPISASPSSKLRRAIDRRRPCRGMASAPLG